ncbi:hypothetical protein ACLOJK_015484 [Asimina triloba]
MKAWELKILANFLIWSLRALDLEALKRILRQIFRDNIPAFSVADQDDDPNKRHDRTILHKFFMTNLLRKILGYRGGHYW